MGWPIRQDIPAVAPYKGELLRFQVRSKSRPGIFHLVDLEAFDFNGQCDCERFNFGCFPKVSRGQKASEATRCSHVRLARSFFLDEILPKLAKALTGKSPTPTTTSEPKHVTVRRLCVEISKTKDVGALIAIKQTLDRLIEEQI